MSRTARNTTINLEEDDGDYHDWLEDMNEEDDARSKTGAKSTQDNAKDIKDPGKTGTDATDNAAPDKPKRVLAPRAKLDATRLCGPLGLPALVKDFENVPWKGKGREEEDLLLMMRKMENWAHAMYPKFRFDDILDRIELLGRKREVRTCVRKIMDGFPVLPEDFVSQEQDDGRATPDYNLLFQKAQPITASVDDLIEEDFTQQPSRNADVLMEDEFEEMLANMEEPDMDVEVVETDTVFKGTPNRPQLPKKTAPPNKQESLWAEEQMEEDDILDFINKPID